MAELLIEVESPEPAGTVIAQGSNPGIDAAFAAGDPALSGVTINAQGNYETADGVELTYTGASTTAVDETQLANYADEIAAAADLSFLAGNTGVLSSDLNAAYGSLGIDSSADLNKILEAAGYNPGEQGNFYGSTSGPIDIGAKLLYEKWQTAPTAEDIFKAGLDPDNISVINSNAANAFWLENAMAEAGYDFSNTSAIKASTATYGGGDQGPLGPGGATSVDDMPAIRAMFGNDETTLDMLEWDDLTKKKKKPLKPKVPGSSGSTGNVSGINPPGSGQINEGMAGSYGGPAYVSTPTTGIATPIYSTGQTGLSEVNLPDYSVGLRNQETEFTNRAATQAGYYQPQTQAEKESLAASDPNYTAPAFENVLYRNRFGMTMYIQHINGVPSQPIPPGYTRVTGFGTEGQGAAATGGNQGGMIQGFNDGALVNPAINFQPGGAVVEQGGVYRIKYPDGTYSQGYDTANNAANALNMGMSKLGLPDYNTYITNQGIDRNLPGYDETQYRDMYQSYIQNPATLAQIEADKAKAIEDKVEPLSTGPVDSTIGSSQPTGQTKVTPEDLKQYQANLNAQAYAAPAGAVAASPVSYIDPNTYSSVIESTAGQTIGTAPIVRENEVAQIDTATTTDVPQKIGSQQITANQAYSDVKSATDGMSASQMVGGPTQTVDAATATGTSVSGLDAATDQSVDVTGAPTRTLQTGPQGELISGSAVDQTKVGQAFGTGEVQAASIQNELAGLMSQFEGGETPAWAAGSMRKASQMLAERGLGASSMAGQAIIQAAMEAALPIAQIDTANKQQMALFKAEQRAKFLQIDFDQAFQTKVMNAAKVSDIANINFTAEQQIALENSKAANTMKLQNLSNSQALIMAEAASLSQIDMANLNNRQQAAVQNAQNFLQVDMANLSNSQQTALFKQQSLVNSILSDQAAANAALQFNATSENQTNQFFANLASSVNQFNAAQVNAMKQFNADEVNSLLEFNAGMQNQREMFNAQNYLVVAQANAQWRQNLATINTATANESNMEYTRTVNGLTMKALDEIWQRERDTLSMAFQISENNAQRANAVVLEKLAGQTVKEAAILEGEIQAASNTGLFLTEVFKSIVGI